MIDKIQGVLLELVSIAEKKEENLKAIERLTKDQSEIFNDDNLDIDALNKNLDEKQKHIDIINELDLTFEDKYKLFKSLSIELKKDSEKYSPLITKLQGYISSIHNIISEIKKLEEENKKCAASAFENIKKDFLSISRDKKAFSVYNKNKINVSGSTFDKSR